MVHNNDFNLITIQTEDMKITITYDDDFFITEKRWCMGAHFHNSFECHYIYSGATNLIVGNNTIKLNCGDLCIIPPKLNHYVDKDYRNSKKCSFLFSLSRCANIKNPDMIYDYYSKVYYGWTSARIINNSNGYKELFAPASELVDTNTVWCHTKLKTLFLLFFINLTQDLIDKYCCDSDKSDEIVINKINNPNYSNEYKLILLETYLQNHFTEPITLDMIATKLHLSLRQTERTIFELTGMSFNHLLIKLRMEKARELIFSTNMTAVEISEYVGYSSYSSFQKMFRKTFGVTINDLRRS